MTLTGPRHNVGSPRLLRLGWPLFAVVMFSPAQAEPLPEHWAPPPGLYLGGQGDTFIRLELREKQTMVVWLMDSAKPERVVKLEGRFDTTAVKSSDHHVTYYPSVETCERLKPPASTELGKCQATKEAKVAGLQLRSGNEVRVTLSGQCVGEKRGYQICFHQTNGGSPEGTPVVVCSELWDPKSKCQESPPIDGSLINAPPGFLIDPPEPTINAPHTP